MRWGRITTDCTAAKPRRRLACALQQRTCGRGAGGLAHCGIALLVSAILQQPAPEAGLVARLLGGRNRRHRRCGNRRHERGGQQQGPAARHGCSCRNAGSSPAQCEGGWARQALLGRWGEVGHPAGVRLQAALLHARCMESCRGSHAAGAGLAGAGLGRQGAPCAREQRTCWAQRSVNSSQLHVPSATANFRAERGRGLRLGATASRRGVWTPPARCTANPLARWCGWGAWGRRLSLPTNSSCARGLGPTRHLRAYPSPRHCPPPSLHITAPPAARRRCSLQASVGGCSYGIPARHRNRGGTHRLWAKGCAAPCSQGAGPKRAAPLPPAGAAACLQLAFGQPSTQQPLWCCAAAARSSSSVGCPCVRARPPLPPTAAAPALRRPLPLAAHIHPP